MDKVCRAAKGSPLCGDRDQMKYIDNISTEHGLNPEVLIGISYAESKIGLKFAPKPECSLMNNWGGIKGFKRDDGSVDSYKLPYKGCWLYPFKNMNEYWDGLANTVSMGYVKGGCDNLSCLSSYYVGTPGKPKSSWIIRVSFYMNYK